MKVVSGDDFAQNFNRPGHLGAIFLKFNVVQEQVKNVPIAGIVAVRADLVLGEIVFVGIGRGPVWLEACRLPQSKKLFSDDVRRLLKAGDPLEFFTIPPCLEREAGHQVGAAKLPRVVSVWKPLAIKLHEEPIPTPSHDLILWVAHLVLDELAAG